MQIIVTLAAFLPVFRDLSLEVKDSVLWDKIREIVDETKLGRVSFLNDYYGKDLPRGFKGIAIRMEFSAFDKTLTDAEADKLAARVFKALERKLSAKLR